MSDKQNKFLCQDCGPRQLEFERRNIVIVDEYNRPVNPRMKVQIACASCKKEALVVKQDPVQAKIDEQNRQALGQVEAEFENKVIVKEAEDPNAKFKPIVIKKGYF